MHRRAISSVVTFVVCGLAAAEADARPHRSGRRAEAVSPARAGHCENPQWSRDGKALVYERVFLADRKIELNLLADVFGGRRERRVRPKFGDAASSAARQTAARFKGTDGPPAVAPAEVCREFTWGPRTDPDIFAYACNVAGGDYQVFWNEGTQLTRTPGGAGQPALSPVGWRLAYVSAARGAEGVTLVQDLMESTQPRAIERKRGRIDRFPVWRPDGQGLAFVGHTHNSADLYLIENIGRPDEVVRLTKWPDDELNPSWSPDGRRLAFFANRGKAGGRRPGYDLYVMDIARGDPPIRVAENVVLNEKRGPAWTPDGRHIVFVKNAQRGRLVDPLYAVEARVGAEPIPLRTGTVSNQDPSVGVVDGRWSVAFTSLGFRDAKKLAWRRVFVASLEDLHEKAPEKPDRQ